MVQSCAAGRRAAPLLAPALCAALMLLAPAAARAQIAFGQLDDYQSDTMNWTEGVSSPNPPTHVATGGPDGAGDGFLHNVSTGGFGAGSRQVMFNNAQWTGDYNAAGVTRIEGFLANLGSTTLNMRVAIENDVTFTRFGSMTAVVLPPDGVWRPVAFDLTTDALTKLNGADTLAETLDNITELRLVSSAAGPIFNGGDQIPSTLGADDLRALRLPGDADFDGEVDMADFDILKANFTQTGRTWNTADFNFDTRTDIADFFILRSRLGQSLPGLNANVTAQDRAALDAFPGSIPEPSAVALVLAGGLMILWWRR